MHNGVVMDSSFVGQHIDDYEIHEPNMDITIKLKRPGKQYSIYEDHPEQKKDQPEKK